MANQTYTCTRCNQFIQYGTQQCPYCGVPLIWMTPARRTTIDPNKRSTSEPINQDTNKESKGKNAGKQLLGAFIGAVIGAFLFPYIAAEFVPVAVFMVPMYSIAGVIIGAIAGALIGNSAK